MYETLYLVGYNIARPSGPVLPGVIGGDFTAGIYPEVVAVEHKFRVIAGRQVRQRIVAPVSSSLFIGSFQ